MIKLRDFSLMQSMWSVHDFVETIFLCNENELDFN